MKILVSLGTYERIVFGCEFEIDTTGPKLVTSKDKFAVPAHIASVRSIAACKKYLVSGSTDETIKIFDLRKKKDIGSVVEHSGSINSLEFFGTSHLLTGSDDGKLALFRTSDWECLHIFMHKSPVSSVAIHPSGKLALSVSGKDKSLRIWNLVTGKAAGRGKTLRPVDRVFWSPTGALYALQSETSIAIYDVTNTKEAKAEISCQSRKILTSCFVDEETILFAGEGSSLTVARIGSSDEQHRTVELGQKPRIKAMNLVSTDDADILVTVASEGSLCLWSLADILGSASNVAPLARHSIPGLRPICMASTLQ